MKQKAKLIFLLPIFGISMLLLAITAASFKKTPQYESKKPKEYNRIISTAPSITETLFALELGDKVIGVSDFCKYPPQVNSIAKFGGLMNMNIEAVTAAEPDLVIIFRDMNQIEEKLKAVNIETLTVPHITVEDIKQTIMLIGQYCGKYYQAVMLNKKINQEITEIKNKYTNIAEQKILIVVDHSKSQAPDDVPENIYIAGKDGFYSSMLKTLGCENAYDGSIAYPSVSYESIIKMNPDVIIDIVAQQPDENKKIIKQQWKNLQMAKAVKNDRVFVVDDYVLSVPGPRFVTALEKIANIINEQHNTNK